MKKIKQIINEKVKIRSKYYKDNNEGWVNYNKYYIRHRLQCGELRGEIFESSFFHSASYGKNTPPDIKDWDGPMINSELKTLKGYLEESSPTFISYQIIEGKLFFELNIEKMNILDPEWDEIYKND